MRIPEPIAHFLRNATIAIAGTRDENLVPHVHRPSGWNVSGDGRRVECLFPEHFSEHLLSALRDNGQIALTLSEAPSHVTYQVKGACVETGPVTESDRAIYERCRERTVAKLCSIYGFREESLRANLPEPSLRVVFEVREVFDQTPGPNAGRPISEEAP